MDVRREKHRPHPGRAPDESQHTSAGPRALRNGIASLGLLCLSLGAGLLISELLVRWVAPQQLILVRPDMWQPVDTLGWVNRPNADTHVNTGERTVRWITDDRGFRVPPHGTPKGEHSILILGDSFMAALQVDYEQSLPGLMEEGLKEALGRPVAVHNSAVTGWDPPHYLLKARRMLQETSFDLVLVAVYLGNDIVPGRIDTYEPRSPTEFATLRLPTELSWSEFTEAFARPVNDHLKTRSHLFLFLKNNLELLLIRLDLTERYMPWGVQQENRDAEAWGVTANILADVASHGEKEGTPTLFVLIPSEHQVNPRALRQHAQAMGYDPDTLDPEQPSRIMTEEMQDRGLWSLDVLPALRAAHDDGRQVYGSVDPHFTPAGHEIVWEAIRADVIGGLQL